ncbi:MAG: hypothetical protein A2908_03135 [Candidatus Staskawiczbacteria bacterium RIFCSPLOWO2_01_FULL_38_12b]|uniref:HhH-GPD domain-containing protein n=1 Tax=Candidatus Staskawiczbacteria bacterium RIFCSPLOWO2_01_FULL_38_12b TaxID=1802214 RepID=A0A1G2ID53_9BACT|nr:MAG: hypothetical protein A2908_03135 [Candidatus Staskawiczbacteria bacterium RIFCSPLOWO2_01_FULL_38_12b]
MSNSNNDIKKFQKTVWDFYKKNKRDFPWRQTQNPYHILVSEIMLQQTQADRVVRYFENWIKRFPDFTSLAQATFSQMYPFWQGLGYNRRALALKRTAEKTVKEFGGKLPTNITALEQFPGIGPYTARAVSIFSFNTPVACIETNIRRVFIHHFFPSPAGVRINADSNADLRRYEKIDDKAIMKLAELALDKKNPREWHWALMDYGAYLKSHPPGGGPNPNRRHKNYSIQSKFEGSLRQIRGATLRILSGESMTTNELIKRLKKALRPSSGQATNQTEERIKKVIAILEKEGLIEQSKKVYSLK